MNYKDDFTDFLVYNSTHGTKWIVENCENCKKRKCTIIDRFKAIGLYDMNSPTFKELNDIIGIQNLDKTNDFPIVVFDLQDKCKSFKEKKQEYTVARDQDFMRSQTPEKITVSEKDFYMTFDYRYDLKELERDILIDKKEREANDKDALYFYHVVKVKDLKGNDVYIPYMRWENKICEQKSFF